MRSKGLAVRCKKGACKPPTLPRGVANKVSWQEGVTVPPQIGRAYIVNEGPHGHLANYRGPAQKGTACSITLVNLANSLPNVGNLSV